MNHDWHALAPGYLECRSCGVGADEQDGDVSPVCRPDRPWMGTR